MTIWEAFSALGPIAGVALLAVMAIVPFLLDLPLPRGTTRTVMIPAQRSASPAVVRGHAAVS